MDPVIDWTARAGFALLLGAAAGHKLRDFRRFRATVAEYRMLPSALVEPVAAAIACGELGAVLLLLTPALRGFGLVLAATLLGLYAGAIATNLIRGRAGLDCGCGGRDGTHPIGAGMVMRNLLLAAIALVASAAPADRATGWLDGLTALAAVAVVSTLYLAVDGLLAHAPRVRALDDALRSA